MLGTEIKKYLVENGIKYSFLSEKTGIDRNVLYSILNNRSKMTVTYYMAICDALKLDFYYFINIERKKKQQKSGNPEPTTKERK